MDVVAQVEPSTSTCSGWDLPLGVCTDDLLTNWAAAGLAGVFLFFVGRPFWNRYLRRRFGDSSPSEFTDELRLGLLSEAKRRSWGQLNQMIRIPQGFTDLRLKPKVGLVEGPKANPDMIELRSEQKDVVKVFDQASCRLLIVGEPGSGKTILAYKIASELEQRHVDEPHLPLPLVLNLTSWTPGSSMESWIVSQLCDPIQGFGLGDERLAKQLVSTGTFGYVLDGLDEIPAEHRPGCLTALNEFIPSQLADVPVVVTCRIAEYEALVENAELVNLLDARQAMPLELADVRHNLALLAKGSHFQEAQSIWQEIADRIHTTEGRPTREALRNPLTLALAVETDDLDTEALLAATSSAAAQTFIVESRVQNALSATPSPESTSWLSYVANQLQDSETNRTTFFMDSLTPVDAPHWLRLARALGTGLVAGLGAGLFVGVVAGLVPGVVVGLVVGVVFGLVPGLLRIDGRTTISRYRKPNRRQLFGGLGAGLVPGVGVGLVVGVVAGLVPGLGVGLGAGLVPGLVVGLVVGLVHAFRVQERSIATAAFDQGRQQSRTSFGFEVAQWMSVGVSLGVLVPDVVFGLVGILGIGGDFGVVFADWVADGVAGVVFGLVFGVVAGLVVGLVAGLDHGGAFLLLQHLERRRLRRAGIMPADAEAPFLWATERGLMRPVGGGYQFRHNLIRDAVANIHRPDHRQAATTQSAAAR